MISRIDHVSVAVKDYKRATDFFAKVLGSVPGASGTNEKQGFFGEILSTGDLSRLEILTPAGDDSFLGPFLLGKTDGAFLERSDPYRAGARQ
jgi:catechol 2,3-dioxygenase-like lactoylglutathione lyase family enzyme